MAVRTVTFKMDDVEVRLATMSWAQAEHFVKEGKEMLERTPTSGEWLDRTLEVVARSLANTDAGALKESYDMPTINAMYLKILEASGLRTTNEGEAKAVSISRGSAAA